MIGSISLHKRLPILSLLALMGMLLLSSCNNETVGSFFQPPSSSTVKTVVRTTIPLAYAASAAMAAAHGNPPPNAHLSSECTEYPCLSVLALDLSPGDLPLDFGASGSMEILGHWSTPDTAILTVRFTGIDIDGSNIPFHDVTLFPVSRTLNGLTLVYSSIDVNVGTDAIEPADLTAKQVEAQQERLHIIIPEDPEETLDLKLDAWVVDVNFAGTLNDLRDDSYIMSGGSERITLPGNSMSATFLAMAHAELANDCSMNLVSGVGALQEVSVNSSENPEVLGQALMEFEPACNARMKILLGTGSFLFSTGSSVPIRLDLP